MRIQINLGDERSKKIPAMKEVDALIFILKIYVFFSNE